MVHHELTIKTIRQKQIVDITDEIKEVLSKGDAKDCVVSIFLTHTTAAVTTADLDPGTDLDFLDFLEKIKPNLNYRHPHNPGHAPDHILSSMIGSSISIPYGEGRLILGMWQRIVLVELDGPRDRNIVVSFNR